MSWEGRWHLGTFPVLSKAEWGCQGDIGHLLALLCSRSEEAGSLVPRRSKPTVLLRHAHFTSSEDW